MMQIGGYPGRKRYLEEKRSDAREEEEQMELEPLIQTTEV